MLEIVTGRPCRSASPSPELERLVERAVNADHADQILEDDVLAGEPISALVTLTF